MGNGSLKFCFFEENLWMNGFGCLRGLTCFQHHFCFGSLRTVIDSMGSMISCIFLWLFGLFLGDV